MSTFINPPTATAERVALALNAAGLLVIASPTTATGESVAIALNGISFAHVFADPPSVTGEDLAFYVNPALRAGTHGALHAWRAW